MKYFIKIQYIIIFLYKPYFFYEHLLLHKNPKKDQQLNKLYKIIGCNKRKVLKHIKLLNNKKKKL